MKNFRLAVILFVLITTSSLVKASIRRDCFVSYKTEEGWSKEYKMEIEFATGSELNRRTNTFDYKQYQIYSLVWFNTGEVAIIELDFKTTIYPVFQKQVFQDLFAIEHYINGSQINSKSNVKWKVTAKYLTGEFIDEREN